MHQLDQVKSSFVGLKQLNSVLNDLQSELVSLQDKVNTDKLHSTFKKQITPPKMLMQSTLTLIFDSDES
jgi:hypothetical protein